MTDLGKELPPSVFYDITPLRRMVKDGERVFFAERIRYEHDGTPACEITSPVTLEALERIEDVERIKLVRSLSY